VKEFLGNDLAYHLVIGATIVTVSALLSRAVRWLLQFVSRKIFAKTETVLDDRILDVLLSHVRPLMVVAGLGIASREIRKAVTPADLTLAQVLDYADAILYVVVAILVLKILVGIIREIIHWYLDRTSVGDASNLNVTLGPLTDKAVKALVGLVAIIIVLDHFGINIGSLLVSLGVGSLAVALAAQETLANMIAGIVILVDRPFRAGDRIEVSTGQIGDVKEIGLRSTRLVNLESNVMVIPNSELIKSRITNYSHPERSMRVLIRFDLAYGTDPEKVRTILLKLATAHPDILKEPAPQVSVTALSEIAVQFTFVARATSFATQYATETGLRERAYMAFQEEGIAVPVPRRIVQMQQEGGPAR
jgi:MscS family membrane protein